MRVFTLLVVLLAINCVATAQPTCNAGYKKKAQGKGTVASPEEYDYDITGLTFNLEMSNTSTDIAGNVETNFRTLIAAFTTYAFELNNALTIDSVIIDNYTYTNVATNGSARKVSLISAYPANTNLSARVFYRGTAPSGNGQFFTGGLNHVKLSSGSEIVYSLSDDLFADDWWPCKQSLQDKIDSVKMVITVPDSLAAATNGKLQSVVSAAGEKVYNWRTDYPIEYYLIAVAIGPYKEYNYHMHFTDGSNDSMLVQNFVYDSTAFMTPGNKAIIDSTGMMIDHFSKLFGRYPFDEEKYGHAMTVLNGGMEHQTMTFMSTQNIRTTLVAHELAHQWWGNSVTYGKWEDIWLSEGMATYTEQLFLEQFWGSAAAASTRFNVFNQVMAQPGGSVWVDDTTDVNRIFNGRLTYYKGAAVAHMLRYMAPEDSLFFKGLRTYQQQYKYGTAVTADLKSIMEQAYGLSLDSFFRQWIYEQGYPTFNAKWAQGNTVVHIKLNQTTSHSSVPAFTMPVEVRVTSANGDTTVTVPVDGDSSHYIFLWDKEVTGISVDPDNHIVDRPGSVVNDPAVLSIDNTVVSDVKIYPNPATDGWHIDNLGGKAVLKLVDMSGKEIWTVLTTDKAYIPARNLPGGNYILQVTDASKEVTYHKLAK